MTTNDRLSSFISTTRGQLGLDGVRVLDFGGGLLVVPVVEDRATWAARLGVEPDEPAPQREEPRAPERRVTDAERLAAQAGLRIQRP